MKRIEDLPEELQRIFRQLWYSVGPIDPRFPDRTSIPERYFIAGFDAAMATGGLPQKPKRTIEHVYANDKSVFVLSNDKKVFALRITPEGFQWVKQPDLPQDET